METRGCIPQSYLHLITLFDIQPRSFRPFSMIHHPCIQYFIYTGADFNLSATITVTPSSSTACIDFTDIVVDDVIANEGDQSFIVSVGNSTAMIVIVDDDSE